MNAILGFIANFFLEKVWGLLRDGVLKLFSLFKRRQKEEELIEKKDEQADQVQSVADQIKALIQAGQPVPPELTERLKHEASDLRSINTH